MAAYKSRIKNKSDKQHYGDIDMVHYVLADGKGSYIGWNNQRYIETKAVKDIKCFESRDKASRVLSSSIAAKIRKKYHIETMEVSPVKSVTDFEKIKSMTDKEIVDDKIGNWLDKVDNLLELIKSISDRKQELISELQKIDFEITDIQHYIELGNFNAYNGWLSYKMLQNRLRQRRKIKDELLILNAVGSTRIEAGSVENLHKAVNGLNTRKYAPRVLNELFKYDGDTELVQDDDDIPIIDLESEVTTV